MRKPVAIAIAIVLSAVLSAAASAAAKVDLAIGQNDPANLQRGQEVPVDTKIRSGPTGLVVLTQRWPSEFANVWCEAVTVIGYGGAYTVADEATPDCRRTPVPSPSQGQAIASTSYRYRNAGSKADETAPPAVQASLDAWSSFDQWVAEQRRNPAGGGGSGSGGVVIPPPPPQPAGMGALEYNRSYSGADYKDAIVSTAAACAALCAQEAQCRAMTFIPDQSRCWLKSAIPAWQPAPRMISAVKR